LLAAMDTRDYDRPELRGAVAAFGASARASGVPPEQMLIALKRLVADPEIQGLSDWWREVLTDRLVRWSVEGYYRIDLAPDPGLGTGSG
jgi:hypothetical protein